MFRELRLRIRALWKRRQLDRDLQDELAWHMEQRRARSRHVAFGNPTLIREEMRDMWTFLTLEDLWRDLRHAARVLRRTPGNTASIVALLAVGIGVNAAIFSLVNAIFIRELPVENPEELVTLDRVLPDGRVINLWSVPLFEYFRGEQTSMSGAYALAELEDAAFKLDAASVEEVQGALGGIASGNYFELLGVRASIGRLFTPEDDTYEDPRAVIVLSYDFWQRQFGNDPSAIGRRIYLYDTPFTVIGVAPEDFRISGFDYWVPLNMQPAVIPGGDVRRNPGRTWLSGMGRLKPGVSRAEAQAEAQVIYARLMDQAAPERRFGRLRLDSGSRGFGLVQARYGPALRVLMGAVGMLLLLACANVASLLLARAGARQREVAVRQALGCGRRRLIRQFLAESLLLAAAGGAIGMALAVAGARGLMWLAGPEVLQSVDPRLDANVLLFTTAISAGAAIVFGLAPALRGSRVAIDPALRASARATESRSRLWINRGFVISQAALSVVLVAGAALFAQSLYRLYSLDPGFERGQVITATVNARAIYPGLNDERFVALARRLEERLLQIRGVRSVSVAATGFLTGASRTTRAFIEGREELEVFRINQASRSFIETLGVPMVAGRSFTDADREGAPRVAVVNEVFARTFFPGENALGKRFWSKPDRSDIAEIVGIAGDSKYNDLREEPVPLAFLVLEQFPARFNHIELKVDGSLAALLPFVTRAILDVDPRLRPTRVETLDESLDRTVERDILLARLSGLFGALALLVACFGVYGMISYIVALRTPEIGVRLAIGAQPSSVLAEMVRDALKTIVPGVAIGLAGALMAERFIASMLFGSKPHDPLTYGVVALGLLATAAVAAYGPARRASRIDPIVALRCE